VSRAVQPSAFFGSGRSPSRYRLIEMKVILYQYPGSSDVPSVSPPCLKIYMALRYIGVEHEVVNLRSPARAGKLSKTGRLPVAEIDGRLIPDSIDILDALETRHPDSGLRPADPRQSLRDRLWEHFVNDHLYFVGYYLRWIANRERTFNAMFGRAPWTVRLGGRYLFLPRARRRAEYHGIGGKDEAAVHGTATRAFSMLADGLEGGPYLQGRGEPARGDFAAAGLLAQIGWRNTLPGVVERLDRYPVLRDYTARVFEACKMTRPKWLQQG
jgi:glutathione S-transferase